MPSKKNYLVISRASPAERRRIDFLKKKGITFRQVLEALCSPFPNCPETITLYNKKTGEPVEIPRQIFKEK